jgi:lysylphosphatidylglycerol synthetase-like protein (DUF2156 family)
MTEILTAPLTVLEAVQRYTDADNPSAFLAVNDGNSVYTEPDVPGLIVYRDTGSYSVQFGGPFAPAEARDRLLGGFLRTAAERGRRVVAVQLQAADVPGYLEHGCTVNQIGASYAVDLTTFTLRGTRFMQLRNKISRSLRSGLTVREAAYDDWSGQIRQLDRSWLTLKGEHAKPLEFLVGQLGGDAQALRRLFIAELDGELVGYISYSPVYGSRAGWMHDLSRRRPDVPPGVMEAINKTAIDVFTAEGVRWLHFGFTPFTGLDERLQFAGHSRAFHWFMEQLWEHGAEVYPAQTQLAYKEKWAPDVVLPEYVAFAGGRASIPGFAHIFRACGAL